MTAPSNSGRRDVAIYAPYASPLYERNVGATGGGGAELQTTLLAHGLAERGLDVAHIVYPIDDPRPLEAPAPALVHREYSPPAHRLHAVRELAGVWRALTAANAEVVVVRGSGGYVVPAAAWCRRRGRSLVFAASNDLDFDLQRPDRRPVTLRAYGVAARQAKRLVVQTSRQAELAPRVFPTLDPVLIPSFAQPAEPASTKAEYFLWIDRLVSYKHPERFLDLVESLPEARFRMIAPESSETAPDLKQRVHARVAALPNVEMVGQQSREQIFAAMHDAAAVVKTSEVEGMPNTFLEAWSRGLPVLSLSVDPDHRIEEHGVGLLAGGSPERFAAEGRRLWEDVSLRAEIGRRGLEFVRATHSPEAVLSRWVELLNGVLSES